MTGLASVVTLSELILHVTYFSTTYSTLAATACEWALHKHSSYPRRRGFQEEIHSKWQNLKNMFCCSPTRFTSEQLLNTKLFLPLLLWPVSAALDLTTLLSPSSYKYLTDIDQQSR